MSKRATNRKPLVLDLFSGLWGWTEGFLAEGWEAIGIDLKMPPYIPDGARFAQFDILQLTPKHIRSLNPDFIVASPPCTEYSYRAMPWKRAKQMPAPDNTLFNRCFEIQKWAGCGMVVENVCGAQKWVGQAKWHYGSFYLWGDVPALMPTSKAVKVTGQDWNRYKMNGQVSPHWRMQGKFGWSGSVMQTTSSGSRAREMASALIAKIPLALSQHVARLASFSHHATQAPPQSDAATNAAQRRK